MLLRFAASGARLRRELSLSEWQILRPVIRLRRSACTMRPSRRRPQVLVHVESEGYTRSRGARGPRVRVVALLCWSHQNARRLASTCRTGVYQCLFPLRTTIKEMSRSRIGSRATQGSQFHIDFTPFVKRIIVPCLSWDSDDEQSKCKTKCIQSVFLFRSIQYRF
jgi:hypothetical protein